MSNLMTHRSVVAPFLLMQAMVESLISSVQTPADYKTFNALWVPFVIVMAGAAAMTVWCTLRGYSGFSFEFTWRGFRAKCV